jgi:hypothetical protein
MRPIFSFKFSIMLEVVNDKEEAEGEGDNESADK